MGSQKVGYDLTTKTTKNNNKYLAPTYSRPPLWLGISSPTLVVGHATGKAFFCALKKKKGRRSLSPSLPETLLGKLKWA